VPRLTGLVTTHTQILPGSLAGTRVRDRPLVGFGGIRLGWHDGTERRAHTQHTDAASDKASHSVAFVAPAAVFAATAATIFGAATARILLLALVLALFNGFLEEVFWRGLSIANARGSLGLALLSTLLFGTYHFSFLFLNIVYQGRAAAVNGF